MQIDRLRSLPRPLAYILPGGGALAAYQVGVLDALTAEGLRPDRLIGVSAGAMNAALFAWSSDNDGVRRIERIWANVKRRDLLRMHPGRMALALAGKRASFLDNRHGIAFLRKHLGERLIQHAPDPADHHRDRPRDRAAVHPGVRRCGVRDRRQLGVPRRVPTGRARRAHADRWRCRRRRAARRRRRAGHGQRHRHHRAAAGACTGATPPGCRRAAFVDVGSRGSRANRSLPAHPTGCRWSRSRSQPSSVTTFAVGSAAATIEGAREFTEAWLHSE